MEPLQKYVVLRYPQKPQFTVAKAEFLECELAFQEGFLKRCHLPVGSAITLVSGSQPPGSGSKVMQQLDKGEH